MDLKQELIDRLCVPENWDKYDYQTQRYSFDDMQEVLEDIVKKLTVHGVVVNEADIPADEPVKLWDEQALELASREEELLCQCGKPMEEPYAPCCSLTCWREMF